MIKPALWALLIIVSLILQASLLPLFAYNGIRPDLLLVITVSAGLLFGREHGVAIGFFAGLLQDLASGGIFGLNTLPKLLLGFAAGTIERKVFKEHILLPLTAVMLATIASYGLLLLLLIVLGYKVDLIAAAVHNLLPLVIYNMIFAVPVHWVVHRLGRQEH